MAIEEELELNITQALDAIQQMASSLNDAVLSFFVAFDDALKQIAASQVDLTVQPEFLPPENADVINDVVAPEQTTTVVADSGDFTGAAEAAEEQLGDIEGVANVKLEAEDAGLGEVVTQATTIDENPEMVVGVDADTSEAQDKAQELKETLEEPAVVPVQTDNAAVESSTKATQDNAQASKDASEENDALSGSMLALGLAAKGTSVALAAGVASITTFFAAAVQSESATISFNKALGDLAPAIAQVNVAGLNIELAQLAQNLGSDDEAVLGVAQRFGLLGITSGAAAEDIALANNQLFAVAANLRSVNPSLGQLDEIASRAGQAFIRGGRAAASLGINLTSQEIRARAAELAGKDLNDTLSQFELFAGGASLAAEQFGSQIERNVAAALENPVIALDNLRQILGDTFEELGKPFVVPVISLLRDGLPVFLGISEVFAELAEGLLPVLQAAFNGFAPIVEDLTSRVANLVDSLLPSIQAVSQAVFDLVESFGPTLSIALGLTAAAAEGLGFFITPLAEAFSALADSAFGVLIPLALLQAALKVQLGVGIAGAISSLAPLGGVVQSITVGLTNAATTVKLYASAAASAFPTVAAGVQGISAAVGKASAGLLGFTGGLGGLLLAVTAAAAAIGFLIAKSRETPPVFDEVIEKSVSLSSGILNVNDAFIAFNSSLDEYITKSEILKNEELISALAETGLSVDQFSNFIQGGTNGLRDFAQFLATAGTDGALQNLGTRVRYTASEIENLSDAELRNLFETRNTTGALNVLGDEYARLSESVEETRKNAFELTIAQNDLGDEVKQSIEATASAASGEIDYALALQLATGEVNARTIAERDRKIATGEAAVELRQVGEALNSYKQQLALGVQESDILTQAMVDLGVETEQAKKFVDDAKKEIEEFTNTVVANVPSVVDAFQDLSREEGGSFAEISANLEKNLNQTVEWSNTLVRLASENKTGILRVAAEVGAERTAILLEAYAGNETQLNDHLNRMLLIEAGARVEAEVAAKIGFAKFFGLTSGNYDELANMLRLKAVFGPITEEDFRNAIDTINANAPTLETEAGKAAEGAKRGFSEGFRGLDFDDPKGPLATSVENQGQQAQDAATQQGNAAGQKYVEGAKSGVVGQQGTLAATFSGAFVGVAPMSSFYAYAIGVEAGQKVVDGFVDAVGARILRPADALNQMLLTASVQTSFASQYVGFIIAGGIGRGIVDNAGKIGDELVRAMTFVVENYRDEADLTGWYLGDALAGGLKRGLTDSASSVARIAADIIKNAEIAAKDEAESDSPSKVWERLGRDLVAGLSNGLNASSQDATRAARGVISGANNASPNVGGNNISVTIPVTVSGNADPAIGRQIGVAAGRELRNILRLEGRVA